MPSKQMSATEYRELMGRTKKGGGRPPSNPKGTPTHNGVVMKSWSEVRYADHLECLKRNGHIISWSYEPERFVMGTKCSYTPDFRLWMADKSLVYVEVKGYLYPQARVKFISCAEQNVHARFVMVGYDRKHRKEIRLCSKNAEHDFELHKLLAGECFA